jgi:hypothetical protein
MNTTERIKDILSYVMNTDRYNEEVLKLMLEALVLKAQLEQLEIKK